MKSLGNGSGPRFSSDGEKIAFEGARKIWIMDRNGENKKQISSLTWDFRPSFSPDDKQIVFQSYGLNNSRKNKFAIWVVNTNGMFQRQFIEPAKDQDQTPRWSPDGKQIVWTHGKQLWIADSSGENAHPLTKQPAKEWEYIGDWSHDGKTIAYLRCDDYYSSRPYKIWFIDIDGSNQRMFGDKVAANSIKWSKDKNYFYYSNGDEIFKVNVDGSNLETIHKFGYDYDIQGFDLSPDEKYLIFDNSGPEIDEEIFIVQLSK